MEIRIAGPPSRAEDAGARTGAMALRVPLSASPDDEFIHKLTRAAELDHRIFEPEISGSDLLVRVRTGDLADPGAFMDLLADVIDRINGERRERLEEAARARARAEQRRAEQVEEIDRGLAAWWKGRAGN